MTGNRTPNTAPYIIYMPAIFIPNRSDTHNTPVSRTKAPQTHSKIRHSDAKNAAQFQPTGLQKKS